MFGVIIAFKNYNFMDGILGSEWVRFSHFSRAFGNSNFWRVFRNTLIINGMRIIFAFPAPIILALLINEIKHVGYKRTVQTISYLPHFLSWVIVHGFLFYFFSPNSGIVNRAISVLGGESIFFMGDPSYFRGIVIGSGIWKIAGWNAIIYLAALAGIDQQLYEAATIDGAGRWRQMFSITIPTISPVIAVMFILMIGHLFDLGFEQIFALVNPAVMNVGETLTYYVYNQGLNRANNFSYAAAVGLFKGVISLMLILIADWGSKKIDEDGGLW